MAWLLYSFLTLKSSLDLQVLVEFNQWEASKRDQKSDMCSHFPPSEPWCPSAFVPLLLVTPLSMPYLWSLPHSVIHFCLSYLAIIVIESICLCYCHFLNASSSHIDSLCCAYALVNHPTLNALQYLWVGHLSPSRSWIIQQLLLDFSPPFYPCIFHNFYSFLKNDEFFAHCFKWWQNGGTNRKNLWDFLDPLCKGRN